jgi:hypothetical protein
MTRDFSEIVAWIQRLTPAEVELSLTDHRLFLKSRSKKERA